MVGLKSHKVTALLALLAYLSLWHGLAHGVVLCMAEDGRSHLEVHSSGDCSKGPVSAGESQDLSAAGVQIQNPCQDYAPDLLAHQRPLSSVDAVASPAISAAPIRLWFNQAIVPPLAAAGRHLQPTGPPRVALVALRSTVLRH
ncbi:MAG: hypothetical protein Tsb0017_19590 [Geothermobacteraceae bacterium]